MKVIKIDSSQNPRFKSWVRLKTSREIQKQGCFIISGERIIQEFLSHPTTTVLAELRTGNQRELCSSSQQYELNSALFKELDFLGTDFNLLLLKTPNLALWNPHSPPSQLEVVTPLGDPANLGALARSCLAFNARCLILTQESCSPFHPKAIKASSGALLRIPILLGPPLIECLKSPGPLYVLDAKGENIHNQRFPKNMRLILGEEGLGVPLHEHHHDLKFVGIPTSQVESLNASVAAGIVLFSIRAEK